MDGITRTRVFSEYEKIYSNILDAMYPAKNSTGFPERNLSVNFSKAYEKVAKSKSEDAFTWFEFQFGDANNLHVDAVILNTTAHELLAVESKRYSNPASKIKEVGEDIDRISCFIKELAKENREGISRIDMRKIEKVYGVILADVWLETQAKIDICESYIEGMTVPDSAKAFVNKYESDLGMVNKPRNVIYSVASIKSLKKYDLLSMMWEV